MAHQTLRLRAAHRRLQSHGSLPRNVWESWDSIVENSPWTELFNRLRSSGDVLIESACSAADSEALLLELGPANRNIVSKRIRSALRALTGSPELPSNIVLIGGPPCQAYSIVGRSRNRGIPGYRPEKDPRHFLYLEYLHVIAEFSPALFVMENVKGILTSKVKENPIFEEIIKDLRSPGAALGRKNSAEYELIPLAPSGNGGTFSSGGDFLVQAEEFGVPQARHRVIILGVRKDVLDAAGSVDRLRRQPPPSVQDVIADLPQIRAELSYRGMGMHWKDAFRLPLFEVAIDELRHGAQSHSDRLADMLLKLRRKLEKMADPGTGAERWSVGTHRPGPSKLWWWFNDRPSRLLSNHQSRSHMPADLVRYLFTSAFGHVAGRSPRLADFPPSLLPEHKNVVKDRLDETIFKDRFRVQLADQPAMTVTSHIAKDGHAFIHPDPHQCRSLTVREAARLQTFPDTYVFLGSRTSQYTQVGNAVPPLLATQIAEIVAEVLRRAKLA